MKNIKNKRNKKIKLLIINNRLFNNLKKFNFKVKMHWNSLPFKIKM
jgi:hypothetical protein